MNFRIILSILLTGIGLLLAFFPAPKNNVFVETPEKLLKIMSEGEYAFTVDQVARFVNNEDSTVQIVDVRTPEEFRNCNIPGSINIPLSDMLNPDWEGYLRQENIKNIFYSNGDRNATLAWSLATGLGYKNNYVMYGGLNDWYNTIMLSNFEGKTISPRENAVFENRFKARRIFNEINSLPDSIKLKFLEAKRLKETQLDGGCE